MERGWPGLGDDLRAGGSQRARGCLDIVDLEGDPDVPGDPAPNLDAIDAHAKNPIIVRIWRGRTPRERADEYEAYNYEAGIKPLLDKALGVQTLRGDREDETEFMTISYWESVAATSAFTSADPRAVHHLERDPEFLIELPERVQILRLGTSHGVTGIHE